MNSMTEAEAKQRWCPMVRAANGDNACNAGTGPQSRAPHYARCAGDGCMMWQWDGKVYYNEAATKRMPNRGYCGLARREEMK